MGWASMLQTMLLFAFMAAVTVILVAFLIEQYFLNVVKTETAVAKVLNNYDLVELLLIKDPDTLEYVYRLNDEGLIVNAKPSERL